MKKQYVRRERRAWVAEIAAICGGKDTAFPEPVGLETDNNGNKCFVFYTGFIEIITGKEILECRCTDGSGMGYVTSRESDGSHPCWMWYGPQARYKTLGELLQFFRDIDVIA